MLSAHNGVVRLEKTLEFTNVEGLLTEGYQLLLASDTLTFDLSGVPQADSAGLALLIAWWRFAKKHGVMIRFSHLPDTLKALMAVTNVDSVLGHCLC